MTKSGEHKQHVHDSYGKKTASSSNVKDTDEDGSQDQSKVYEIQKGKV